MPTFICIPAVVLTSTSPAAAQNSEKYCVFTARRDLSSLAIIFLTISVHVFTNSIERFFSSALFVLGPQSKLSNSFTFVQLSRSPQNPKKIACNRVGRFPGSVSRSNPESPIVALQVAAFCNMRTEQTSTIEKCSRIADGFGTCIEKSPRISNSRFAGR